MINQTIVVIGGSSGIGLELSLLLGSLYKRIIIAGRNKDELTRAAGIFENPVETFVLDAHKETELQNFFAALSPVDHLVSMVGDSMQGGFMTTSNETMRHVLHSKFYTNWLIGKYAASKIKEGGSLTFTAGTGGKPHEIAASYVANLGVRTLVEGLAFELAPRIRVNAVSPTFMGTQTHFWKDQPAAELKKTENDFIQKVPLKRLATKAEVAAAYVHFISNAFITGQVLAVDGGVML